MPQIEAKGAAVVLAFMAGVMTGLSGKDWTLGFVACALIGASLVMYKIRE